jgi:hypothetical protein
MPPDRHSQSKSRMISFRVTEEEYDRFRSVCFSRGIPSVSELARAAIDVIVYQTHNLPQSALEYRVTEIEDRIQALSLELKKVNQRCYAGTASAVTD